MFPVVVFFFFFYFPSQGHCLPLKTGLTAFGENPNYVTSVPGAAEP